jgi:hypothetical protein
VLLLELPDKAQHAWWANVFLKVLVLVAFFLDDYKAACGL